MDYFDYSPKTDGTRFFPSVVASTSNPKTLLSGQTGVIYVNLGAGWLPLAQESSGSIYAAYTGASAATQTAIQTNLGAAQTTGNSVSQTKSSTHVSEILVRGR